MRFLPPSLIRFAVAFATTMTIISLFTLCAPAHAQVSPRTGAYQRAFSPPPLPATCELLPTPTQQSIKITGGGFTLVLDPNYPDQIEILTFRRAHVVISEIPETLVPAP